MYANFIRELRKEPGMGRHIDISEPNVCKDSGTIRSGILVRGISDPIISIVYDVMTKEYLITDSVKPDINQRVTTNCQEALEYIRNILEVERLKKLIEEIKLLEEDGEI